MKLKILVTPQENVIEAPACLPRHGQEETKPEGGNRHQGEEVERQPASKRLHAMGYLIFFY